MIDSEKYPFLSMFTEAEDDDTDDTDVEDTGADDADTTDGGDADNEDTGDDDDDGNDEFDIDTTVDDDDTDDEGGDAGGVGGDSDGGDTSSMGDAENEANPINTEIFDSLTPEEQSVKIKELKRLYRELYTSVVDISKRLEDTKIDEDNIDVMDKLNNDVYTLKNAIRDYFTSTFETKSYIENDIKFSQFLFFLNSIRGVMDDFASSKEREQDKDNTKVDKKY